tara:strand:+ start:3095 stop:4021 length:927 start_codon:yes stop_codon:yes gene_type:complete
MTNGDLRIEKNISDVGGYIFNTPTFFSLHNNSNSIFLSFFLNNELIGNVSFRIETTTLISPVQGTFGGVNFNKKPSLKLKQDCITLLIQYLQINYKSFSIQITQPPLAHDVFLSEESLLMQYLGFEISKSELNHSIVITKNTLEQEMSRNNIKRLKKCNLSSFEYSQSKDFKRSYEVINENRKSKNIKISMSYSQIMKMQKQFPNDLFFFDLKDKQKIIASSLCIRIKQDILYVFYWGDLPGYEKFSPIVSLSKNIYDFAVLNGFKILDIGTSSLNGEPNHGLIKFKEGLGFKPSLRHTYTYTHEKKS